MDSTAAPEEFKRRIEAINAGDRARVARELLRTVLEERQGQIIGKIEAAIADHANSAGLKDELLVLCVALCEARGLWNTLDTLAEQGDLVRREFDEDIRARAAADTSP